MKTQTESMSARIRVLLAAKPERSAKAISKTLGCTPALVHQVKSYDKQKAEKQRSQKVATAAKQSLAGSEQGKRSNGVEREWKRHDVQQEGMRRISTIVMEYTDADGGYNAIGAMDCLRIVKIINAVNSFHPMHGESWEGWPT